MRDIAALGTPTSTLSNIQGSAVSGLQVHNSYTYQVQMYFQEALAAGITTATLTTEVGDFTASTQIRIEVLDVPVPTDLTGVPALVNGSVNTPILVARPGLSPADTGLSENEFEFDLYAYPGEVTNQGNDKQVIFREPGYHHVQLAMSYRNINLQKSITFAIADESGVVPGELIKLTRDRLENQVYLSGSTNLSASSVQVYGDLSAFGTGSWSLTDIAGDAVSGLKIGYQSDDYCALQIDSIHSVGQTTATLTFTVGEFSKVIPVVITVIDAPVPTELTNVPSLVNGQVNTPILVARPGVSPADTGIKEEDFEFSFYSYAGDVSHLGADYEVVFSEPGYHKGTLMMHYHNILLEKLVMFAIADENGQVPGDLIDFGMDSYQRTHYLKGHEHSNYFSIYQRNNLTAFGEGTWTLSGLSGDAIKTLTMGSQTPDYVDLYFNGPFKAGVSTATLTYTVGEYSKALPITITISDEALPTRLDMPTVYQATVGNTLHIPRPGLLPKGSSLDNVDYHINIWADGDVSVTESGGGYDITFNQAGYLTGMADMSYANFSIRQNLVFEVKDASGTVPGSPFKFTEDKIEETYYFTDNNQRIFISVQTPPGALAYGTPVFTLTNVVGTSVKELSFNAGSNEHWNNIRGKVVGTGDTTATLNCTAGPHTVSIPVILHVPDVVLPTGFDLPAVITGQVNQEIVIRQPSLLPATTPLSKDDFNFNIDVYFYAGDGESGYSGHQGDDGLDYFLTFSEPGYYKAYVSMSGNGFYFDRNVVFQIQDESGTVPGNPYSFSTSGLDLTFYLDDKSWTIPEIQLDKFLPDQGQAVWSYRKLDAAAPSLRANLWLSDDRQTEYYDLNLSDVTTEGTFRYEVVCVLAGRTHIIPVNITFTSKTPPSLSLENTVFTIKAQEWFTLPRPVFNPGDSGIDGSTLEMNIWGDSEFWDVSDVDANQHVKIFEPGYYSATIQMVNDEYDGRIDISFIVTSPDGTPPDGAPLKFEEANANFTINKQGGETVRGFYGLKEFFPGLGKPVFTIETLSGDAVTAVVDTKASGYWYGVVHYTALKDSGQTVFRLKVSAGGYEDSMQITVTVDNRTVPTEMVIPAAQYEVTVGQPLTLGRPQLLPQNTQVSTDLFRYDIYVRESEATTTEDTKQQKTLIFHQPGYYTVLVYMSYNNISFNKELLVTVKEEGGQTPPVVMITSMEFDKAEDILPLGETRYFTPEIQPVNPSNKILTWTSSDETVLKNATGEYWKAIKPGTATLTAMATDGSGVTASIKIIVPDVVFDLSKVKWDYTDALLYDGTDKTVVLTGLPLGVSATYEGNQQKDIGTYTAKATLVFPNETYEYDPIPDLTWEIKDPVPSRPAPKIKVETVNQTTLKISWARVTGASGYNIWVSMRPNDSYTLLASTTGLAYNATRLTAGTRYFYKVEAYDLIGGVNFTSSPLSTWGAGVPIARAAITSITSPSRGMITLTWNKPAGAAGYAVLFATAKNGPYKTVRIQFTNSATFRGLKSGSTFYFKVQPYKKYYAFAYWGLESPVRAIKVK